MTNVRTLALRLLVVLSLVSISGALAGCDLTDILDGGGCNSGGCNG